MEEGSGAGNEERGRGKRRYPPDGEIEMMPAADGPPYSVEIAREGDAICDAVEQAERRNDVSFVGCPVQGEQVAVRLPQGAAVGRQDRRIVGDDDR